MLNLLLITLGPRGAHRARGPVARAGRVPGRHADRRDRIPLPGRGGHQAVPRRAARAVLRHRRDGARPHGRRQQYRSGCSCCSSCPVVAKLVLIVVLSRVVRRVARRRRCATASISRRRASSRWCCWRSPSSTADRRADDHAGRAGGDGAVDAVGAARHPVRRADRAPAHRERLARARGADHAASPRRRWPARST